MYEIFLYIFTYLLLGASCSSPSRPIDYGTELTATDSICLSIDEHTHYESKSIFQFEENGHEYLSFWMKKQAIKFISMIWIPNKLLKQFIYKKRGEMQCHQLMAVFHLAQSIFNYNLEWSFWNYQWKRRSGK